MERARHTWANRVVRRTVGFSPVLLVVVGTMLAPGAFAQDSSGADLFKSKCLMCHGSDGSGSTALGKSLKAADLRTPIVQKKTNAELIEFVAAGKGNMPPFRGPLTDDEIRSVVTYVRTFASKSAKKKN
jgi:mono/diheme cytochrome c family protein